MNSDDSNPIVLTDRRTTAPGLELARVLQAAASAIGVSHDVPGWTADASQRLLGVPDTSKICVLLVDGLGYRQLLDRGGHAPFLRSLAASSRVLGAPFPSTTTAALGVFGTARPAGQTGLLGYSLVDPKTDQPMSMLAWDGVTEPEAWQRYPTVFETCALAGVPATYIGMRRFEGSGLSRAALRGATFLGVDRTGDGIRAAVNELSQPGPRLVYLYWGDVDRVGHQSGWQSWQWGEALETVDAAVRELVRSLPPETVLLITADHGMVDIGANDRYDIADRADLTEGIRHVAGEPRALHLYCEPYAAGMVKKRWRAEFEGRAEIFTRAELITGGVFGTVDVQAESLIGDVVVAVSETYAIVDSRTQSVGARSLIGMHGSMSPEEMEIPLMMATAKGGFGG